VRSNKWLAAGACAALAFGAAACGSSNNSNDTNPSAAASSNSSSSSGGSVTLNGAGSTFAAPIYQQVASDLKSQGITENYQSVGSGAGVSQFTAGTVDFAGSDPALKDEEISALKKGPPIEVPFAFGAITVSYKLSGVKSGLKLDGKTIADIYLGKVKKWNDPEIAQQNSGQKLPSTNITVVHRSDSSGTTKGFTDFMSRYSPAWKSGPGVDKDIKWPTGTGGKGNEGVAAAVKQTEGAIGYVEQAYALQNGFTFADVKNKSGSYVAPTLESTSAAGDGIDIPSDLRINVIDSPNPKAYPVTSQTFAITYQDPCKAGLDKAKAAGLKKFLSYLVGAGQDTIAKLSYAKIPSGLQQKVQSAIDGMQCNGTAIGS
jgi:phosphate transport system substrate-binding protein